MCLCPRIILKFSSLILMVVLMIFCANDIYVSSENLSKSESNVKLLLILSISVNIFLSVALFVGFYAGFRDKSLILQLFVFVLIGFTLSKLTIWIIAGNTIQKSNAIEYVAHGWFRLSIFAAMLLIVFVTLNCLKLQDDDLPI